MWREAARVEVGNKFVSEVFQDMDGLVRAEERSLQRFITSRPKIEKNTIAQTVIFLRDRLAELGREKAEGVEIADEIELQSEDIEAAKPARPVKLSELDEPVHLKFLELEHTRMDLRQGIDRLVAGTRELAGVESQTKRKFGQLKRTLAEAGEVPDLMPIRMEIENARLRHQVRALEGQIGKATAGQSSRSLRL
jgi:hypothetical protein